MILTKSLLLQTIFLIQSLIQNVEANQDTNSCENLILQQNELYCEFRDLNYFFIGQNSDNFTNTDTFQLSEDLIQVSSGPLLFSKDDIVISIKFRELINENEICSLIYNTQINTYSLNCISTSPTFIIDNKFQLLINTQFNLEIQTVQTFNCSQFDYNTEGYILFCYSIHQIKLYQLSIEQHKLNQTVIFQSENHNLQCLLKFHSYSNSFLIIYFQCLEWKIQIYENNTVKLEIDQNYLKEKYNIEGNLLEVLPCQSNFLILLSSGGYWMNNENLMQLFITQGLKLNETLIEFNNKCQINFAVKAQTNNYFLSSLSQKYSDIIFNTKDFPKQMFVIKFPSSIFFKYEDYLTFYINDFLHQSIKLKIKNLLQLSNQRIYMGIGEDNQIILILIKYSKQCLPSYNINNEYSKYYIRLELAKDLAYIQNNNWDCYKLIIIDNDEQKKQYALNINLKNKNYYIERTNYDDKFLITIIRSSFSSIQPHRITFSSSSKQINLQLKSNQVKCQFNRYLKNYKGKFFIKTKNDQIYSIIVEGYRNNIVEYSCDNQNNHMFESLLPLNKQIVLNLDYLNSLLLLDQQKRCLYKLILHDENLQQMPIKITCLESQIEKIFNINYKIILKLKDQFVFYNLQYTQPQLEQAYLPKQINLNCLEIYQLLNDFIVVVYTNELQLIYKEVTVQIIKINAKVLGCKAKSQSTLLINLILLDLIKNELQLYILSITEFRLIRSYNLENNVPIQPLQFIVQEQIIIISCKHKINNKLFLLIFKSESQISFHSLQQVIETKNHFFFVQKYFLYYFNDQNQLSVQDLLHITIQIEQLEFNNKSSQEVILQFQVELEDSEIPPMNQSIMIKLINPSILKLIQSNQNLYIKYENQELNFRHYILGKIDNIYLKVNNNFKLKYPFENQFIMQCSYYCNKFCFQFTNSGSGIFFKVGQSNKIYMIYGLQHYIQNILFIEMIKDNQFLFIHQINNETLQISLMILKDQILKLQKQIDTHFNNDLEEIVLVQNILIIQFYQVQNRFIIDENDISQVIFPTLNQQSLIYNLSTEQFIEVFVNNVKKMIIIKLFKIINYKVEFQSIFEISIMNYQLKELFNGLLEKLQTNFVKLINQNFSQVNQQIDLILFIISNKKFSVQFQIRLYLKEKRYELENNKILRYPENYQPCKYIVIAEEEIILQCGITRYYYDMKDSDYLFDPIHSTKNLLNMDLLNSTHYLFYKHFEHNQSIVLYAGKRGGYVLQKQKQDITYPITLEFSAISNDQIQIDKVSLQMQVYQQNIVQKEFSQQSLFIFIMILIIVLATITFYYRKHQIKNKQFSKVINSEISLSTIKLKNPSQI
ncbi:unnamed protein product [Paramecium primaurelia]|uniref:Transmembrane protein n=1 Tax=Paramecium primaurelia TaxID=5886 RepID=A0A8S1M078_PARPR|nr:unnamed protein product [Paramecium primaurelia]